MFDHVLSNLNKTRKRLDGSYEAQCPCHEDNNLSLTVSEKGGFIVLYCRAGCTTNNIVSALDLEMSDLDINQNNNGRKKQKRKVSRIYDYTDRDGKILYQVLKYEDKSFSQRHPDGNNGWIFNVKGVKRVPYRLPKVIDAVKSGEVIFVVEDEKDVHTLESEGFSCATTNSGGAGKWFKEFSQYFEGADVVIIPDNDKSGKNHAQDVARKLNKSAAKIRILTLPGLKKKQNISDWLELNEPDQLKDLIGKTPVWKQENALQSPTEHEKKEIKEDIFENAPFQCLGVDHRYYYYLSHETKQIIKLSSNNHTSVNLISLADLKFWETYFKLEESNEISWKSARNSLFRTCHKLGIFDPKRVGDQLGALLAGAYSLYSDNTISYEDALEWVRSHDWETDRSDGEKDEARCLNHILQNVVSVEVNGRRFDRTLGNLIANVSDRLESSGHGTGQEDAVTPPPDPDIDRDDAKAFLKRHGMRIKDECIWISNSHREMKKLFKDTAWHTGWKNMLLRIDGAESITLMRFGPGTATRTVGIPLHYIFGE